LHKDGTTSLPITFSGNIWKALENCHEFSVVKFEARQNNLLNVQRLLNVDIFFDYSIFHIHSFVHSPLIFSFHSLNSIYVNGDRSS